VSRIHRPLRWVLDTNVVLSALVRPGGTAGELRRAWQADRFVPLVSRATASELLRVLHYPKFKLSAEQQHDLLAEYLPWTEVVFVAEDFFAKPYCRDPDDAAFLQLAYAANADALISGDRDLLVLATTARVSIHTLAQALSLLLPKH
jgi:putative PIN family toxin of toxin-antitoxin system